MKNLAINISSNILTITWDAPFSLDLTDVEPDIVYCVQISNNTCRTRTTLFNNCNILETELNLIGYSQYVLYEVIITPRSNVEGAIDGNPFVIRGKLLCIIIENSLCLDMYTSK